MLNIIYTRKAINDLIEIKDYVWQDNILYSIKIVNNIKSTISLLKTFPKIGTIIEDETRFIVENNYAYKIVYEINKDNIYILWIYKYKNTWM